MKLFFGFLNLFPFLIRISVTVFGLLHHFHLTRSHRSFNFHVKENTNEAYLALIDFPHIHGKWQTSLRKSYKAFRERSEDNFWECHALDVTDRQLLVNSATVAKKAGVMALGAGLREAESGLSRYPSGLPSGDNASEGDVEVAAERSALSAATAAASTPTKAASIPTATRKGHLAFQPGVGLWHNLRLNNQRDEAFDAFTEHLPLEKDSRIAEERFIASYVSPIMQGTMRASGKVVMQLLARFGKSSLEPNNPMAPLMQIINSRGVYMRMTVKSRGMFLLIRNPNVGGHDPLVAWDNPDTLDSQGRRGKISETQPKQA
ncbi:hypothetical protein EDD21DRAFT_424182 [Dissophora ornata]|nr:hypothetical protein EDD21DRAFT_424182 [Dissophora ornata]